MFVFIEYDDLSLPLQEPLNPLLAPIIEVPLRRLHIHSMRMREMAPVQPTGGAVLAVMAARAVEIAAVGFRLAGARAGLVFEDQELAGAEALAVQVVAVFAGVAAADEVVVVAAFPLGLEAFGEAAFGGGVGFGEFEVEAVVVGVQEDVAAGCTGFFGGDAEGFGCGAGFADGGPR